jgi:hypothetical protein
MYSHKDKKARTVESSKFPHINNGTGRMGRRSGNKEADKTFKEKETKQENETS